MNRSFNRVVLGFVAAGAWVGAPASATAQSAGFSEQAQPLPFGAAAIAYAPDGTLFVVGGGASTSVLAINPNGTQSTINLSPGFTLDSPGGAAFDPTTGNLLVTDLSLIHI